MAQGLQIFSASGNLVLDISERITRTLGEGSTGLADGSISVPQFSSGAGWVYVIATSDQQVVANYPRVVATTSGVTWTFPTEFPLLERRELLFTYGVY